MREWLVIEDSGKNAVFASAEARTRKAYIPRDVVEGELGIKIEPDGRATYFTPAQIFAMKAHREWSTVEPIAS